jgi:hypothetical protein
VENSAPRHADRSDDDDSDDDGGGTWAEPLTDSDAESSPSYRNRLLSATSSLLSVHLEVAKREATRDQQRLVRGLLLLLFGGLLFGLTLVLVQFLAVAALQRLGLSQLAALAAVTGADLATGLLLVALGRRALRGPILPQTRAVLQRTWAALRSP